MKFFNIDGKFAHFMTRLFDLAVLNFLFLFTSIPLLTIGSSYSALYGVTLKMSKNCESYICKSYFKYWKSHFNRASLLWLVLVFFGAFIVLDRFFINYMNNSFQYLNICFNTLLLLWIMTVSYVFPLLAHFNNDVKQTLRNALFMSIRHLPWTLLIFIINIVPAISIVILPPLPSTLTILFMMTIGFSTLALLNSYIFKKRIFPVYDIPSIKPEHF